MRLKITTLRINIYFFFNTGLFSYPEIFSFPSRCGEGGWVNFVPNWTRRRWRWRWRLKRCRSRAVGDWCGPTVYWNRRSSLPRSKPHLTLASHCLFSWRDQRNRINLKRLAFYPLEPNSFGRPRPFPAEFFHFDWKYSVRAFFQVQLHSLFLSLLAIGISTIRRKRDTFWPVA